VYALLVFAFVMIFYTWLLAKYGSVAVIRRQYEEIRLAKEEAEQANQAKSQFLANMSHEIRTPINTIMGMDELILRENKDTQVRNYAQNIQTASTSLLSIINDILDLSKIETGKMNIVEQEYDTASLLGDLVDVLRVSAGQKGLSVKTDIAPDIPVRLYGDQVRIRQVVLNLLSNAVKYTPEGTVRLCVRVNRRAGEDIYLDVSVEDTGIGIREEDRDKLFTSFERLDEKRNARIQGTGLGLNITKRLLTLMGSEITCDSEYGKGSRFGFTLRQKVVEEKGIGSLEDARKSSAGQNVYVPRFVAPQASILVIDDNNMNLEVVRGLLKATKIQVTTGGSGKECLEKIKQKHFDVIFLDHMMPDMDGIETLSHIREQEHLCKDTPVIILTANAIAGAREEYLAQGFTDYLSKPIVASALEEMLYAYLPKEKLETASTEKLTASDLPQGTAAGDYGFRHIDTEAGMAYCGDQKDFYESVLQLYGKESTEKQKELAEAIERQDWEKYSVLIHALKSTSRTIGAMELGKQAEALEKAGKSADAGYILSHHAETMELYQEVIQEIRQYFG
jgi:signal transduction histidine kinase/CheY-like chemotaxis protein